MGALPLPPALLRIIEGLRRAFLWNIPGKVTGAKCLVAWAKVCRPKSEGGLGIKSIAAKNEAMQLKLVHRLHADTDAPWPRWAWREVAGKSGTGHHWAHLAALQPLYRSISAVRIGDGKRTSFWLDSWLGDSPFAARWPALFSHSKAADKTVWEVVTRGVRASLVPRLNAAGLRDWAELEPLLATITLTNAADARVLNRCGEPSGALCTGAFYKLRNWGGVDRPAHAFVWGSFAPSKVQFFSWLLSQDRIQCRASLLRKHILAAPEAGCAACGAACETADHVCFGCPVAKAFWNSVGCNSLQDCTTHRLHLMDAAVSVPPELASTFLQLCTWHLWKQRNALVFRGVRPSLSRLRSACREDVSLWHARLPRRLASSSAAWLACLGPM
ncbi:unnamed protein product [Alopecurus aequalis]